MEWFVSQDLRFNSFKYFDLTILLRSRTKGYGTFTCQLSVKISFHCVCRTESWISLEKKEKERAPFERSEMSCDGGADKK